MYLLKLYVLGITQKIEKVVKNLQQELDAKLGKDYTLEIINLLEKPRLAADDQIIATPTLVKKLPPPVKRIIGDLSDVNGVLVGLNLISKQ